MKKISTLSHAKAVHAVKSIGKVLLPVALLLAAILCIGVCAGAEDEAIYTYYDANDHVKKVGNSRTFEAHTFEGPACSTSGTCVCGAVGTKVATNNHTWDFSATKAYLKEEGVCPAESTYYYYCKVCKKIDVDETKEPKQGDHSYNQQGTLVAEETVKTAFEVEDKDLCKTLVRYQGKCACGVESTDKANYKLGTTTYGHGNNVVHFNGTLTAEMPNANVTIAELAVNGSLCGLASEYHDFCQRCGDVLTSTTKFSGEALETLSGVIHAANENYKWTAYNSNAHWSYCSACNTNLSSAMHTYTVEEDDVTCSDPRKCTGCDYVAKSVPHAYVEVSAVAPTCEAAGNVAYKICSVCNGVADEEGNEIENANDLIVPATGHKQKENAPACAPGACTICGKGIAAAAEHEWKKADKYTVDSNYELKKSSVETCDSTCKNCGAVKGTHNYELKTSLSANEKVGCDTTYYTWLQCKLCGNAQNIDKVEGKGHTYSAIYRCGASRKCTVCGEEQQSAPHKLADGFKFDCDADVYCENCHKMLYNHKHKDGHRSLKYAEPTTATCSNEGSTGGYYCDYKWSCDGVEGEYACTGMPSSNCKDNIAKKDHAYGEKTVTKPATCVQKGKSTKVCSVCGDVKTEEISKDTSAHVWSSDYRIDGDGNHYHYCINQDAKDNLCGAKGELEAHTYYVTVNDKKIAVTEADCRGEAVCVCGKRIEAAAHKFTVKFDSKNHWDECVNCGLEQGTVAHATQVVPAKSATCAEDGYDSYLGCTCGYGMVKSYPATGDHGWTAWTYSEENTVHSRTCTVCQKTQSHDAELGEEADCLNPSRCKECKVALLDKEGKVVKAALGHDFVGVEVGISELSHSVACKRCNAVVVEAHRLADDAYTCKDNKCIVCNALVKATAEHKRGEFTYDANKHYVTCSVCGDALEGEAHYNKDLMSSYDCTKEYRCDVCDYLFLTGYQTGHDIDTSKKVPAVEATCTTDGHAAGYKCTRCDYIINDVVVKAKGHDWAVVAAKEPTETEDGYTEHKVCTVCGETEGKEVLPKTGSSVVKGDFNGDGKVTSDDAIALLKAIMFGGEANQPTDYNGDGKSDTADAIALLKAAMFG